jgi:glutathione S-transferase
MPLNPNATIEITAFRWVPPFAQGVVRDLRARWAMEEAGLDYRVRLLGPQRPAEYLREQPFDQVPTFSDGEVRIFESGAIAQYVGEQSEALLPRDKLRRPGAVDFAKLKLRRVSDWLGDKEWLEGRFTIGDLIMVTSLRFLRDTDLVANFPNLEAYVKRAEARPAFQQALSDQLHTFKENEPAPQPA